MKYLFLLALLGFTACKNDSEKNIPKFTDTPTSGQLTMSVDESFKPVIQQQIDAFHVRYVKAKIKADFQPERAILKKLFNRETEIALLARNFTKEELKAYKSTKAQALVYPAFYDAVVVVANAASAKTSVTPTELKSWLQSANPTQQIFLDNTGSGVVRFLQDQAYIGKSIVAEVAGSPEKVLEKVAQNANAIGLVPMNWVSDKVGLAKKPYGNRIKILGLETQKGVFYPTQQSLSEAEYPLRRTCYILDISGRGGLARGFSSFATAQIGQLVVLKSGLLPADIPERIINLVD